MASGADLVNFAMAQLGEPYEFGATGPNEWDCSGLIWQAARNNGINIPRTTATMYGKGSNLIPIKRDELQAGDVILSKWDSTAAPVSHAAMWVGDGKVIEAPQKGVPVKLTTFNNAYASHTVAYRRIPGVNGAGGGTDPVSVALAGITGALPSWITKPNTLTDAASNIGSGLAGIAGSAQSVAKAADLFLQAFTPGNILRGFSAAFGVAFLLIGIWFLAREVRESTP